ncbi:hypothetical protein D3C84_984000 [compost metagenome]
MTKRRLDIAAVEQFYDVFQGRILQEQFGVGFRLSVHLWVIPLIVGVQRTAVKEPIGVDRLELSNLGIDVGGDFKTQCPVKRKPGAVGTWTGELTTVGFFITTGHDLMDAGGAC